MLANIQDVNSYSFSKNEVFLIDTNIWMYIHYPRYLYDPKFKIYSNAFGKILKSSCNILLDALIVSEFINTWIRNEYNNNYRSIYSTFKSFRQGQEYKSSVKDIANALCRILRHSICINNSFNTINISSLIADFESKCLDFNDQILVQLCISNQAKLITHDSDFGNYNITMLTANNTLLSQRQVI